MQQTGNWEEKVGQIKIFVQCCKLLLKDFADEAGGISKTFL